MIGISARYADQRSKIVFSTNLGNGFEKQEDNFELEGRADIPYQNETKFRAILRIKNLRSNEKFPFFLENELEQIDWQQTFGCAEFFLRQSILDICIPLKFNEFRASAKGNLTLPISENIMPSRPGKFLLQRLKNPSLPDNYSHFSMHPEFYVNLCITLLGDPTKVFRTEWERFEDKSIVSGGRPESNRRKF